MDCKLTSINKSNALGRNTAMTLVETMVALVAGGMILGAIGMLALWASRSFAAMTNYVELDNASRIALDQMTRDIRQVHGLASFVTNQNFQELTFTDSDGAPLIFRFTPADETLVREKGNSTKTLLEDCKTLTFSIFQRNNVAGTYNQYDVLSNNFNTCKLVQVSWVCSRKLLPTDLINSESVQTAKIVIRHR